MKIEFDPAKSATNNRKRRLSFELAAELGWSAARVRADDQRDYGEERFIALVPRSGRLYVVCYCIRGDARRIISSGKRTKERSEPMKRPTPMRPLTDKAGEVRELTEEDMRLFKPIAEVDPGIGEAMREFRRKVGRPKATAPKVHVGFRLAQDVVASIKASGRGYNARIEQVLREAGFGERKGAKRH